jgi:hypothetical protein
MGFFWQQEPRARLAKVQEKILFSIDHRVNRPWPHHLINAARYADEKRLNNLAL